jgi:glutamyl-tRNA synthetase
MPSSPKPARVRFAPSPTGHTHLASGRTALYNYLLARQTGGEFVLRIEDTDQKRYVPGAEVELIESLHWLGLDWDEGPDVGGPYGPYRQTERREIYQEHAEKLIETGHAYYCFCTPQRLERIRKEQQKNKQPIRYDGLCRWLDPQEAQRRVANGERHVIRFKMPEEGVTIAHDQLRGDIVVDNHNLEDHIIVRSDGLALYHLAAIVDDHLMRITHVFRGNEWLATFPLHVQIIRAFGWEEPLWVHLSLFLNPSGKGKMSKRNSGGIKSNGTSFFLKDLESAGYLPEAVVNWVALMGWSYDDRTEVFSMQELIEKFSLDHLNPSPAAINYSKLDHFNGLYIRRLQVEDLANCIRPFLEKAGYQVDQETLLKVTPIIQVRIATLDEAPDMAGFFFKEEVNPSPQDLVGEKMTPADSAAAVRKAYQILAGLVQISHDTADTPLRRLAEELGLTPGQLFGMLRSAVTGQKVSPPLFESMAIIGKDKVLKRLEKAILALEKLSAE